MHLWVWNLSLYIVIYQGEYKSIFILDIGDQNTTHVFAPKGTHAVYLN